MLKKLFFLAALFTATVMNLNATTVSNVKYIDADGKEQTCTSATVVENASAQVIWSSATTGGWYVVNGTNVQITKAITCLGAVHLILADGAALTSKGIVVSGKDNSITIYGQSGQTGRLYATGEQYFAGIGGSSGSSTAAGSNIIINGGTVTATGGESASGIGGGNQGAGSNITINGGTVTATGGSEGGTGIGGGRTADGSNITINGGKVTATGNGAAAGIGGGSASSSEKGNCSNIAINGGIVTATGGQEAAGIGGGCCGNCSNITINGGTVTATGGSDGGVGIGKGVDGFTASNIFVNPSSILKADGNNPPTTVIAHATITTDVASLLAGKRYATVEPGPDMHDFLYFVGLNGNDTVRLNKVASATNLANLTATFEYSKDRINWESVTWATDTCPKNTYKGNPIALAKGDTVFFRAKGTNGKNATMSNASSSFNFAFGVDDSIAVGGNTMSLYDASCEQDTMTAYGFAYMFRMAKQLVSAPKLPTTQLANSCYYGMFIDCTALTQAPELKATTLATQCYGYMFWGCTALTQAPELKATTLANACYQSMFDGCTSLTQAPELNATTLAQSCYMGMFMGCTSLTKAPELKATTLAMLCYGAMFTGCTSLQVDTCADGSCGGVKFEPTHSTTPAPNYWNINMFKDCKGDAKYTAATGIQLGGHYCIKEYVDTLDYLHFVGLNGNDTVRLNKQATTANLAKLTATFEYSKDRINWTEYTWSTTDNKTGAAIELKNAGDTVFFRAKGTNGKNATMGFNSMGYFYFVFGADDSIAAGGNVMSLYDAECKQDTMTAYGFVGLFNNATQLVSAPKLPATKLAYSCYYLMFSGCTALTQAPELKATTLAGFCYQKMFQNCTSLTQAPELKATTLAQQCYQYMFQNCSKLEVNSFSVSCDGAELEVPTVSGTAPTGWNQYMFQGCKGDAALTAEFGIQLGGHYCIQKYVEPAKIIVVYDLQGHGEAIKNDTVVTGNKLTEPAKPTAQGYEFRNWYTDAQSMGTAFDFSKTITATQDTVITLYAKWRDPAAWEQFQKDLNTYSYVEYDSTYTTGFKIHLATTADAQVKDTMYLLEVSADVISNYDFRTFTTTIVALYPAMNDELGKCTGVESPSTLIAAYTQLPYRANGLNAVCGLYTSYFDLVYKAWAETNYDTDTEICKCMLNSDVFFKGSAKLMEAFDESEK